MTSLDQIIVWQSTGYTLLGALLLAVLIFARLPWPIKAGLIVLTTAFYIVNFFAAHALLGWSSVDPLPPRFKLLSARIVEPHSLAGDSGAIHLWVEEVDEDNFPSGEPRAYRLPYDVKLAERTEAAIRASADGHPQGGRTADVGAGNGGEGQATATGGGDPSTGGPVDPDVAHGDRATIVFAPLAPPRMPPKDAQ